MINLKDFKVFDGVLINVKNVQDIYREDKADSYWDSHPTFFEEDIQYKIEAFKNILPPLNDDTSLLEIGCGTGGILRGLSSELNISKYIGCDISLRALKRAVQLDEKGMYIKCDAKQLPFSDTSFDLAILSDVIEHIDNPNEVLKEAVRVSRMVVVKIPCENNLNNKFRVLTNKITVNHYKEKYGHLESYSYGRIKKLLSQHGDLKLNNIPLKKHLNKPVTKFPSLLYTLIFGGFAVGIIYKKK